MSGNGAPPHDPIAYVSRDRATSGRWIAALSGAMPGERVVPFAEMDAGERARVRLAVVTDPDPADLAALPALEWVHSTWAGVERMVAELPPALPIVRMTDPRLAEVMGEAVLATVLWWHRGGFAYAARQRDREWHPEAYRAAGERRIGILGLGALGLEAARRLVANGFAVTGWSRAQRPPDAGLAIETAHGPEGLEAVIAGSDALVVLLPLTDATRGLLDAERLGRMREGSLLVNFARGPIIDEGALVRALDRGRPAHALLDVFATEPLPPDHPFWSHPRVTVWPHVSGPTDPASASALIATRVALWRRTGEVPEAVDRTRGY